MSRQKSGNPSTLFAPIPPRAIGDRRLAATHFRILAAVAYHDRFSMTRKGAAGCFAANKTLAEKCNVNLTNFSTAAKQLGEWGYLVSEQHPLSKRTRVYRVLYDDLPTGKELAPNSDDNDLPTREQSPEEVCPTDQQAIVKPQQSYDNIFRETVIDSAKQEKISSEEAPLRGAGLRNSHSSNFGGQLAIIERELRNGVSLDRQTRKFIEDLIEDFDTSEAVAQQAERLLAEYG